MRRALVVLSLISLSCQTLSSNGQQLPATQTTPGVTASPSNSPVVLPSPTALENDNFEVRVHPDGGLYAGDLVSFEVIAPPDFDGSGQKVEVRLDGAVLGSGDFHQFGIAGRQQATLQWVWDTSGLEARDYDLNYQVTPEGPTWEETITLFPQDALPPYALDAEWDLAESACCLLYYVDGTESERELAQILADAEEEAARSTAQMQIGFTDPIPIVLMPRVLGHGGFAGGEIYISFLDRNYAGNDLDQVLHHEMVHILDERLGGDLRPTMLVEGLAVYLSGGHFKTEPLLSRAAALLDLGWYLPLQPLADDFYFQQHEVGYLEAAALIQFMVDTWGWDAFSNFYRDIHSSGSGLHSDAIDVALQAHFDISFAELETRFLTRLRSIPLNPDLRADVDLTVAFFNTVRRYQQALDPSAYFLTAWLLGIGEMRERGITADYLRHPAAPANITLETMLISAEEDLKLGRFEEADLLLTAANAVLDRVEAGHPDPFSAHPLAADYYAIVNLLLDSGYQPQQITLAAGSAEAAVWDAAENLLVLQLRLENETWMVE